MERSTIHLTSRMQRIMKNAEIEARNSKSDVLQPAHLLVACLKERTGVLGEIGLKCHIDVNEIRALVTERNNVGSSTNCSFFGVKATEEVVHVLDVAIAHMKRYNQSFLNEGHLLKALITTHVLDQFLSKEESEM
ncbi:MAG TPA: Clp protease N-terminal domain-containing protein, partial [Candidatus Angelobacter sp.]|nr:Clp protease N-terminal domain-containing protein [Candidatus Angelobacter sp.]